MRTADTLDVLADRCAYELIFADGPAGKWDGLDRTMARWLAAGFQPSSGDEQAARRPEVRNTLLRHPDLPAAELDCSSGMILTARRR